MFNSVTMINVDDWDCLVQETYGRTYSFQQQDGCKERGVEELSIPIEFPFDYEKNAVPEVVNSNEMGVSFQSWLDRDPNQQIPTEDGCTVNFTDMWWERNFYPSVDMIANDLYNKGLLPKGTLVINIDW